MIKQNKCDVTKLYKAILTLETEEECAAFFGGHMHHSRIRGIIATFRSCRKTN